MEGHTNTQEPLYTEIHDDTYDRRDLKGAYQRFLRDKVVHDQQEGQRSLRNNCQNPEQPCPLARFHASEGDNLLRPKFNPNDPEFYVTRENLVNVSDNLSPEGPGLCGIRDADTRVHPIGSRACLSGSNFENNNSDPLNPTSIEPQNDFYLFAGAERILCTHSSKNSQKTNEPQKNPQHMPKKRNEDPTLDPVHFRSENKPARLHDWFSSSDEGARPLSPEIIVNPEKPKTYQVHPHTPGCTGCDRGFILKSDGDSSFHRLEGSSSSLRRKHPSRQKTEVYRQRAETEPGSQLRSDEKIPENLSEVPRKRGSFQTKKDCVSYRFDKTDWIQMRESGQLQTGSTSYGIPKSVKDSNHTKKEYVRNLSIPQQNNSSSLSAENPENSIVPQINRDLNGTRLNSSFNFEEGRKPLNFRSPLGRNLSLIGPGAISGSFDRDIPLTSHTYDRVAQLEPLLRQSDTNNFFERESILIGKRKKRSRCSVLSDFKQSCYMIDDYISEHVRLRNTLHTFLFLMFLLSISLFCFLVYESFKCFELVIFYIVQGVFMFLLFLVNSFYIKLNLRSERSCMRVIVLFLCYFSHSVFVFWNAMSLYFEYPSLNFFNEDFVLKNGC